MKTKKFVKYSQYRVLNVVEALSIHDAVYSQEEDFSTFSVVEINKENPIRFSRLPTKVQDEIVDIKVAELSKSEIPITSEQLKKAFIEERTYIYWNSQGGFWVISIE